MFQLQAGEWECKESIDILICCIIKISSRIRPPPTLLSYSVLIPIFSAFQWILKLSWKWKKKNWRKYYFSFNIQCCYTFNFNNYTCLAFPIFNIQYTWFSSSSSNYKCIILGLHLTAENEREKKQLFFVKIFMFVNLIQYEHWTHFSCLKNFPHRVSFLSFILTASL